MRCFRAPFQFSPWGILSVRGSLRSRSHHKSKARDGTHKGHGETLVWIINSTGEGEIRNRRHLRCQKCGTTKMCQIMPRHSKVQSPFLWCHLLRSWHAHFHGAQQQAFRSLQAIRATIQPSRSLQETTATNQRPVGNKNIIHGLCFFLCHRLGILYQTLQWHSRIGVKFSAIQISPFQITRVPNFPPPRW